MPAIIEGTNVSVEFRPTLIVGLGGTGHEVVVRLKARLLDTFGEDVFKIVNLVCFDTADESILVQDARGETVGLNKGTELINIGGVPVPGIVQNLDRHPAIKAWLPKDLPVRAIVAGAAQVRPLGRLAFFYHFHRISSALQQRIRDLRNIRLIGQLGRNITAAESQGINAFVVCSVSGGTGSGNFIDMAYLIRHLLVSNGVREEFSFINGMLVLPQAFATVTSDAIRANAYGALRELDYFMQKGNFTVEYPNRETVNVLMKPFNICYLVDAVNERGSVLAGMAEVAPMVAESILIQIGSQVGEASKSRFDNIKSLNLTDFDRVTAYSGVGIASMVFPAKQMIYVCANRLGAQILGEQILKAQSDQDRFNTEIQSFIESNQLERNRMLNELARLPNGQAIVIQVQQAAVEDIKPEELMGAVKRYITQYEAQLLNTTYKNALENNRKQLSKQLLEALQESVKRMLNNPVLGLPATKQFLDYLHQQIEEMTNGLTGERTALGDKLATYSRKLDKSEAELSEATQALVLVRGRRVRETLPAYMALRQAYFHDQFEMSKRSQAIALLADLNVAVGEEKRKVDALEDKLNIIRTQFESSIARTSVARDRYNSPLVYDITSARDTENYYAQYVTDVRQNRTELLESVNGLASWLNATQDQISSRVLDYGQQVFAPIWDIKIEDVISSKRNEVPTEDRLHALRRDSSPFWNYADTRMSDGGSNMESIRVIGVYDGGSSIYKGKVESSEELASTHDPHTLTVLYTRHGLPLFALQQYNEYRQKYKNHMQRKISPVQLFSFIDLTDDEGEREARQIFALSEAFGFITNSGANIYSCRTADELAAPTQLGQGLVKAVQAFANQSGLVIEMRRVVERHINNDLGRPAALNKLGEYIKSEGFGPNPSEREQMIVELKRLARDYRESLLS